ncbi:MAG: DUF2809 domain-containing protein [Bacteroidaceae bacterium]|nr:DUF2809 domain-containing protein [Bacteroidaceae bacterium]
MSAIHKRRWGYFLALVVVIVIGLLSRRVSFLPNETGDALWVIAVYCLYRMIWCKELLKNIAWWSLLTAYAVEFSQLIRWGWLVSIRSTVIGHLLLGQGFQWLDILAYTIGVIIVYAITTLIERFQK